MLPNSSSSRDALEEVPLLRLVDGARALAAEPRISHSPDVPPPGVQRSISRVRSAMPYLPWLVLASAVALVLLAPLLLLLLRVMPEWIAASDDDVASARTGVLALLAGLVAVVGAVYTAKTYALNRQGQLTDRFTRAVEQLGHDSRDVRLGGIHALERIARESPEDYGARCSVHTCPNMQLGVGARICSETVLRPRF